MPAISKIRGTHGSLKRASGRRTGKQEQAALRSCGVIANGFLKCQFLPLYEGNTEMPDSKVVEKGLLQSLSTLARTYQFTPIQVKDKAYPYNVLLSHWHAKCEIGRRSKDILLTIAEDENGKACFATTDKVDTGTTLYYIPLMPLYHILQNKATCKGGHLLLSVCSYLYKVAGVSHYLDEGNYLYWHYEMLTNWLDEGAYEIDSDDYQLHKNGLNRAAYFGDIMGKRIGHPFQLSSFSERIKLFQANNQWDEDCLRTARTAYELWQQYPDSDLYLHVPEDVQEDDEYGEEHIRIYEYVSFIAETKGLLYDSLSEMVNNDFNERSQMDEPTIISYYNQEYTGGDTLDFERRLFDVIADLCELLNDRQ